MGKLQINIPKKHDVIIAIDPDTKENGVCEMTSKGEIKTSCGMPFAETLEFIWSRREQKPLVVVEAGWLNVSNWHIKPSMPVLLAARIGKNQGENHQRGKDIIEWCEYHGIEVKEQRPLKKCWRGNDGKITQPELEYIVGQKIKRSNQDVRDAILLAWNETGLPIKHKICHV